MDGLGKLDDEAVKLQGHRPSDVAEGGVMAKAWKVLRLWRWVAGRDPGLPGRLQCVVAPIELHRARLTGLVFPAGTLPTTPAEPPPAPDRAASDSTPCLPALRGFQWHWMWRAMSTFSFQLQLALPTAVGGRPAEAPGMACRSLMRAGGASSPS